MMGTILMSRPAITYVPTTTVRPPDVNPEQLQQPLRTLVGPSRAHLGDVGEVHLDGVLILVDILGHALEQPAVLQQRAPHLLIHLPTRGQSQ
jgi:hypothetical protein